MQAKGIDEKLYWKDVRLAYQLETLQFLLEIFQKNQYPILVFSLLGSEPPSKVPFGCTMMQSIRPKVLF